MIGYAEDLAKAPQHPGVGVDNRRHTLKKQFTPAEQDHAWPTEHRTSMGADCTRYRETD